MKIPLHSAFYYWNKQLQQQKQPAFLKRFKNYAEETFNKVDNKIGESQNQRWYGHLMYVFAHSSLVTDRFCCDIFTEETGWIFFTCCDAIIAETLRNLLISISYF